MAVLIGIVGVVLGAVIAALYFSKNRPGGGNGHERELKSLLEDVRSLRQDIDILKLNPKIGQAVSSALDFAQGHAVYEKSHYAVAVQTAPFPSDYEVLVKPGQFSPNYEVAVRPADLPPDYAVAVKPGDFSPDYAVAVKPAGFSPDYAVLVKPANFPPDYEVAVKPGADIGPGPVI